MQLTISMVLKASLCALAFSPHMLLNNPLIAEWQTITCNREALVNDALLKSNQKHINYDYFLDNKSSNMTIQSKVSLLSIALAPLRLYMFT